MSLDDELFRVTRETERVVKCPICGVEMIAGRQEALEVMRAMRVPGFTIIGRCGTGHWMSCQGQPSNKGITVVARLRE